MEGIKRITPENFFPYGWVIEYPNKERETKKGNLFRVVLRETASSGWRIAYLVVRDKAINQLEQHPFSYETFEPIAGQSILYVALTNNVGAIKGFLLDKPVILEKRIWHGVLTLGDESELKITENAEVQSLYWHLDSEMYPEHISPDALSDRVSAFTSSSGELPKNVTDYLPQENG